ncbi:Trichothecene 3-O-acetyltransferase [Beauveria bassiana]|nr:Trichothecene 3-O-acetyltransferase [Beauveria bassiana]
MGSQIHHLRPSGYPNINDQSFRLSTNDLLNPKPVYVPVCLFFCVPDRSKHDVMQLLMTGLEETLRQCRFLAGTIEMNHADEYEIVSKRESKVDFILHHLDQKGDGQSPFASYESLHANHYLVPNPREMARLRVQTVPCGQYNADTSQNSPVIGFQANIIPGGIALAIHFHHWAMDYCGFAAFVHQWAGNTSALSSHIPYHEPTSDCFDRSRLVRKSLCATTTQPADGEAARKRVGLPAADSASDPAEILPFSVYLFNLSKTKAEMLKSIAKSTAGLESACISTYDVIVALWWRVLTRARAKLWGSQYLDTPADFTEAVNIRRKLIPPLPSRYLGNAVLFATCASQQSRLTIRDIVKSASLGIIAAYIRRITDSVDAYFIEKQLEQIEQGRHQDAGESQKTHRQSPLAFTVNDWRAHNLYDADFGFGKPTGVRHLFGIMPVLVVLPVKQVQDSRGEIFEFLVPIEHAAAENLLEDPELKEWFEIQGLESKA